MGLTRTSFAQQAQHGARRNAGGGLAGFFWTKTLTEVLEESLPVYFSYVAGQITDALRQEAMGAENVMKALAPWQDRTGAAREGLQSFVVNGYPDHIAWYFAHGVDIFYGMYLETMKAGVFGIVASTAEVYYPQMMWILSQCGLRVR